MKYDGIWFAQLGVRIFEGLIAIGVLYLIYEALK